MDPNRFDALTRRYATATTRRAALGGLVGGGLLAAFGHAPARAATTCTLSWTANVRFGPSTGAMLVAGGTLPGELKGTLSLALGDDGAIDQGQLRLADGSTVTVVGQALGRALHLRLQTGNGQALVAVGTAEQAVASCTGMIDGSLTGPQAGDLGEWHAVAGGATGGSTGGTAGTTGGAVATNPAPAAPNPTVPAAANPTVSATSTTTGGNNCASGVVCGGVCCIPRAGYTPDQIACDGASCACTYSCQAAGCPYGGTDHSFSVGCEDRPDALCGENCNFNPDTGCGTLTCAPGTTLDPDTCTCNPAT